MSAAVPALHSRGRRPRVGQSSETSANRIARELSLGEATHNMRVNRLQVAAVQRFVFESFVALPSPCVRPCTRRYRCTVPGAADAREVTAVWLNRLWAYSRRRGPRAIGALSAGPGREGRPYVEPSWRLTRRLPGRPRSAPVESASGIHGIALSASFRGRHRLRDEGRSRF